MRSYLDEFTFNPEAAQRIAHVVEQNAVTLEHCADVLEAVGPYCTALTAQGFLQRLNKLIQIGVFNV